MSLKGSVEAFLAGNGVFYLDVAKVLADRDIMHCSPGLLKLSRVQERG
jgi:hypothetical protein